MKKLLVLFVAVVATVSTFAAERTYFSKVQFQWAKKKAAWWAGDGQQYDAQVTFPVVLKGTIAYNVDLVKEPGAAQFTSVEDRGKNPCVITKKKSYPAFMTICQPCLECYPCDDLDVADSAGFPISAMSETVQKAGVPYTGINKPNNEIGEPGTITLWNLYVIQHVDKKDGWFQYIKINLADTTTPAFNDYGAESIFFTGAVGKEGYVINFTNQMGLVAKKSAYSLKFIDRLMTSAFTWDDPAEGAKAETMKIMALSSLTGSFRLLGITGFTGDTTQDKLEAKNVFGTVKLSRDGSWTGKAVKGAFTVKASTGVCAPEDDINSCEEYFTNKFEEEYFGAAYKKLDPICADAAYGVIDQNYIFASLYDFLVLERDFSFTPGQKWSVFKY